MALSMPAHAALVPEIMDREDLVNAGSLAKRNFIMKFLGLL